MSPSDTHTAGAARPRLLVAYASKHGATREIAEAIADELGHLGVEADCRTCAEVDRLDDYGAVVLGSAVYMQHWRRGGALRAPPLRRAGRAAAAWLDGEAAELVVLDAALPGIDGIECAGVCTSGTTVPPC